MSISQALNLPSEETENNIACLASFGFAVALSDFTLENNQIKRK